MGIWAPDGFGKTQRINTLKSAIARLSPSAKQAFHAAATRQEIKRRTWNGCAFNAGGSVVGENIGSFHQAAAVFGMSVPDVRAFIETWDNSGFATDQQATVYLKQAIEEVGLFTEPEEAKQKSKFAGKTFVKVVHESDETREKRIFDQMVKDLDISEGELSDEMQEFKQATEVANELLTCV